MKSPGSQSCGTFNFLRRFFAKTLPCFALLAAASLPACGNDQNTANYRVVDLAEKNSQQAGKEPPQQVAAVNAAKTAPTGEVQPAQPELQKRIKGTGHNADLAHKKKLARPDIVSIKGRGKLNKKSIFKTLQKNDAALRHCTKGQSGQARLTLKINKRGRVEYVKAREKMNDTMLKCMRQKIRRWRFARPRGGAVYLTVQFDY